MSAKSNTSESEAAATLDGRSFGDQTQENSQLSSGRRSREFGASHAIK